MIVHQITFYIYKKHLILPKPTHKMLMCFSQTHEPQHIPLSGIVLWLTIIKHVTKLRSFPWELFRIVGLRLRKTQSTNKKPNTQKLQPSLFPCINEIKRKKVNSFRTSYHISRCFKTHYLAYTINPIQSTQLLTEELHCLQYCLNFQFSKTPNDSSSCK